VAVLEATEQLLAEGASWADLGVERIARAAGISRTAFYFYFKDKRELLLRLTEDVVGQLYAASEAWFAGEIDTETSLRGLGRLYDEHGPLLRIVVEVTTYDEDVARVWRKLLARFVDASRPRFEQDGMTAEQAEAVAFALVWMTERTFYQQMVQRRPLEDVVGALAIVWSRTMGS
jgi:TetR/AcrR family transcriptional regulator, ethionamide resistance regulator